MNRPAALPVPRSPIAPLIRAIRAHAPRPRTLLRAGAVLVVVIGLAALVAVYTPVAHPRDLEVKGATGPKAAAITEALESAARGQSTFAVSEKALMRAVAAYPEVAGVQVAAHPPLRLDLTVQMRVPVAIASSGSGAVTIASDGVVLDRGTERRLPRLDASLGDFSIREGRLRGNADGLKVLEAAPAPLLELASAIRRGRTGIEIELVRGPRLIFGTAEYARDKWAAAAAVLAEGSAAAAFYIDLRVPSRPAVGGLGGSRMAGALDPPALAAATPAAGGAQAGGAESTPQAAQTSATTTAADAPVAAPADAQGAGTGTASAPAEAAASAPGSAPARAGGGAQSGGATVGGGVSVGQ